MQKSIGIVSLVNTLFAAIIVIAFLRIQYISAADEVPAFFLKIAKNIPRLGRSPPNYEYADKMANENSNDWLKDATENKEIFKRKVGLSEEGDTWSWQHFPLSIEGPPELWRTLAGYSHDPLYKSKSNDFNNDLWMRDKRAIDSEA